MQVQDVKVDYGFSV